MSISKRSSHKRPMQSLLAIFLFLTTIYCHALSKQSIELPGLIEGVKICNDSALVATRDDSNTVSLFDIDLSSLETKTLLSSKGLGVHFACDQGNSYFISQNIDDKKAYHATLRAYNKVSPTIPKWTFTFPSYDDIPMIEDILISHDLVIMKVSYIRDTIPSLAKEIFALESRTGKMVWRFAIPYLTSAKVSFAKDMLYITADEGKFEAHNIFDGSLIWKTQKEFHEHYFQPYIDPLTNMLITGVPLNDATHGYSEIIGIDPYSGATKWTIPDNEIILLSQPNPSMGHLVYIDSYVPVQNIYKLNWYQLYNDADPVLIHQWKSIYNPKLGTPTSILTVGEKTLVVFSTNDEVPQHVFVFDEGNKIADIAFANAHVVNILYRNQHQVVYTTDANEFGLLTF
jgi:hypothetical protein